MPEVDAERRRKLVYGHLIQLPRMSSYLLAFAIGDLQGKTAKTRTEH